MVELNYKQINGLLLLSIILGSGATILLQETQDYENCRGEWILQDNGQYECSKNNNLQWCYEIEDRGSGWNRCHIGKIFENEKIITKTRIVNSVDGQVTKDFTISPDGKTCYMKGNLRRAIPCENLP